MVHLYAALNKPQCFWLLAHMILLSTVFPSVLICAHCVQTVTHHSYPGAHEHVPLTRMTCSWSAMPPGAMGFD